MLCCVFQNSKLKGQAFELIGSDEKEFYNLAADTSEDLEDWIAVLSKAMNLVPDPKSCMKIDCISNHNKVCFDHLKFLSR